MARKHLLSSAFLGLGLGLRPAAPPLQAAAKPASKAGDDDDMDADGNKKAKPAAKDGKDGRDGRDGKDGEDGDDGEDGEDGKDGKDGKDGEDGEDGEDGADADDDDDDMDAKSTAGAARLREQARCAAIVGHENARGRAASALSIAFTTRMPRGQAIALLGTLPKSAAGLSRLDLEASGATPPSPGAAPASAAEKAGAGWADAFKARSASLRYAGN